MRTIQILLVLILINISVLYFVLGRPDSIDLASNDSQENIMLAIQEVCEPFRLTLENAKLEGVGSGLNDTLPDSATLRRMLEAFADSPEFTNYAGCRMSSLSR